MEKRSSSHPSPRSQNENPLWETTPSDSNPGTFIPSSEGGYAPTSVLVFVRRGADPTESLEPATLEVFKQQAILEARALNYDHPYILIIWQEEDGHWSVIVPWRDL